MQHEKIYIIGTFLMRRNCLKTILMNFLNIQNFCFRSKNVYHQFIGCPSCIRIKPILDFLLQLQNVMLIRYQNVLLLSLNEVINQVNTSNKQCSYFFRYLFFQKSYLIGLSWMPSTSLSLTKMPLLLDVFIFFFT